MTHSADASLHLNGAPFQFLAVSSLRQQQAKTGSANLLGYSFSLSNGGSS